MKNEVTVNGVKLTRAQIEAAIEELNKPLEFRPGTIVTNHTGNKYLVVDHPTATILRGRYSAISPTDLVVISIGDGVVYFGKPTNYRAV